MSNFIKNIGLTPIPVEEQEESMKLVPIDDSIQMALSESLAQTEAQKELIDDIELAKNNVKHILSGSKEAFDELLKLAKASESPGSYTTLTLMMKAITDANKDYVHLAEKKKYVKEELPPSDQKSDTNVTNNNLIITSNEVLKMLKGSKE